MQSLRQRLPTSPTKRLLIALVLVCVIQLTCVGSMAWMMSSDQAGFVETFSVLFHKFAPMLLVYGFVALLRLGPEVWTEWRSALTPERDPLDDLNVESVGFLHRAGSSVDRYGGLVAQEIIHSEIYVIDRDRGPVTLERLRSPGLQNPMGAAQARALAKRLGVPFHEG